MSDRTTPLHAELERLAPVWTTVDGMPVARAFAREGDPRTLGLADVSAWARAGLKGPEAKAWLARHGVPVPDVPNTWVAFGELGIVARLAASEFFLEDGMGASGHAAAVRATLGDGAPGVYPVPRQDAALLLAGAAALELFSETCSMDFRALAGDPAARPLAMTSMVGVSVLVMPQVWRGTPVLRIWCDPTFGPYLYRTLLEIVEEMGGGPFGLDRLETIVPVPPTPVGAT